MAAMKLLRLGAVALLVVLAGVVLLSLTGLVPDMSAGLWDFRTAYWDNAGAAMHAGGADLYVVQGIEDSKAAYIYPPQLATFFGLLYPLPVEVGAAIWVLILVGSAVWSLWLAVRLADWRVSGRRVFYVALLSLALFGAFFADVYNGNVNSLVIATMLTGVWLVERDKPVAGGAVLIAAAFLKVVPVVLLVWLVVTKRWRAFWGVAVGALVLVHVPMFVTVPVHGLSQGYVRALALNFEYVEKTVAPRLGAQEASGVGGAAVRNLSLNAAMTRLFTPAPFAVATESQHRTQGPLLFELPAAMVKLAAAGTALAMFGCGAFVAWRRRRHWISRAGGAGMIFVPAMLGNVLCWPFHLVSALFLAIPLATYATIDGAAPKVRVQAWLGLGFLFVGATVTVRVEMWMLCAYGVQAASIVLAWAMVVWMAWGMPPADDDTREASNSPRIEV